MDPRRFRTRLCVGASLARVAEIRFQVGSRSPPGRLRSVSAKGSQPVSAKGKLGASYRPGTLRYSVHPRERRKKSFLSEHGV